MTEISTTDAYQEYLDALLAHGVLLPSGVPGVYGKSAAFEDVLQRVNQTVSAAGRDLGAEVLWFPPVVNRELLERADYLKTFPHLAGTVHSFFGSERDQIEILDSIDSGADWSHHMHGTGLALVPAACYPIYPTATGTLPDGGRVFDVQSYCFRHEPSNDPARLQIFRMHEYVRIGTPEQVLEFQQLWLERGQAVLRALELDAQAVLANDPFFGRGGKILAESQREQSMKFELVVPICSTEKPTAVVSCNYHQDHFGVGFNIETSDGAVAHSACVGFGLERITLALFKAHGLEPAQWPAGVRRALAF